MGKGSAYRAVSVALIEESTFAAAFQKTNETWQEKIMGSGSCSKDSDMGVCLQGAVEVTFDIKKQLRRQRNMLIQASYPAAWQRLID